MTDNSPMIYRGVRFQKPLRSRPGRPNSSHHRSTMQTAQDDFTLRTKANSPECARLGRESPPAVESQNQTNPLQTSTALLRFPWMLDHGIWSFIGAWTLVLGVFAPFLHLPMPPVPTERRLAAGFGRPKTSRDKLVYATEPRPTPWTAGAERQRRLRLGWSGATGLAPLTTGHGWLYNLGPLFVVKSSEKL